MHLGFPLKTLLYSIFVTCAFGAISCSTVPDPYIPSQVGNVTDPHTLRGLRIEIQALNEVVTFKQPVPFKVTLQNVGNQSKWVPREPNIIFFWVYPTGIRDHFVREIPETFRFLPGDVVELPPGHQLVYHTTVETFYFPRAGITEFWAVYQVPINTNPQLPTMWKGRLTSNRYGVLLSP